MRLRNYQRFRLFIRGLRSTDGISPHLSVDRFDYRCDCLIEFAAVLLGDDHLNLISACQSVLSFGRLWGVDGLTLDLAEPSAPEQAELAVVSNTALRVNFAPPGTSIARGSDITGHPSDSLEPDVLACPLIWY